MDTIQGYIPLAKAAEALGYASRSTLCLMAREQRIPGAVKIGNIWLLPAAWVEDEKKKGLQPLTGGKRGKKNDGQ